MNIRNLFTLTAVVFFFAWAGHLFFPNQLLLLFGLEPNESTVFMARRFGIALLGYTVIFWMLKSSKLSREIRVIMIGALITISLSAVIILTGIINGILSSSGWMIFVPATLLALGFGYLLLIRPPLT